MLPFRAATRAIGDEVRHESLGADVVLDSEQMNHSLRNGGPRHVPIHELNVRHDLRIEGDVGSSVQDLIQFQPLSITREQLRTIDHEIRNAHQSVRSGLTEVAVGQEGGVCWTWMVCEDEDLVLLVGPIPQHRFDGATRVAPISAEEFHDM